MKIKLLALSATLMSMNAMAYNVKIADTNQGGFVEWSGGGYPQEAANKAAK